MSSCLARKKKLPNFGNFPANYITVLRPRLQALIILQVTLPPIANTAGFVYTSTMTRSYVNRSSSDSLRGVCRLFVTRGVEAKRGVFVSLQSPRVSANQPPHQANRRFAIPSHITTPSNPNFLSRHSPLNLIPNSPKLFNLQDHHPGTFTDLHSAQAPHPSPGVHRPSQVRSSPRPLLDSNSGYYWPMFPLACFETKMKGQGSHEQHNLHPCAPVNIEIVSLGHSAAV